MVDLWTHLMIGKEVLASLSPVKIDSFTFTMNGSKFFDQNWLSEGLIYYIYNIGGIFFLHLFFAILFSLGFYLLTELTFQEIGNKKSASISVIIGIILSITNCSMRPQGFSIFFFILFYYILRVKLEKNNNYIYLLFFIEVLWVNFHGAFPLGIVLVFIFLFSKFIEKFFFKKVLNLKIWILTLPTLLIATLINPEFIKIWNYILLNMGKSSLRGVTEWQITSPTNSVGGLFYIFSLIMILAIIKNRKKIDILDYMLLFSFFILAIKAIRMVVWFGIILPPILGKFITLAKIDTPPKKLNGIILIFLFIVSIFSTPYVQTKLINKKKNFIRSNPEKTGKLLKKIVETKKNINLFTPEEWAGYISWLSNGKVKIFVDGRIDIFPQLVWEDYMKLLNGNSDSLTILKRYNVNMILLPSTGWIKLKNIIKKSNKWLKVEENNNMILFSKIE